MNLKTILTEDRTIAGAEIDSKKRAIECAAQLVCDFVPSLELSQILKPLFARERLGSTAIGSGVAIPHCRIPGLQETMGVLLTLRNGIDFGSIDKQPVNIVLTLLVPEESSDDHLKLLAHLAEHFSQDAFREKLLQAQDNQTLYQVATHYDE
ncbi:MAG: PTS fructose transporter subunit IIA [Legionellales bacterium]|nr:PTS fructose transporter subunit IIA [Legionellales bacterium]|tara:strand:+ start:153 stop:608 length:456 start_codon:yes stop_codon:yes gene_type:complete